MMIAYRQTFHNTTPQRTVLNGELLDEITPRPAEKSLRGTSSFHYWQNSIIKHRQIRLLIARARYYANSLAYMWVDLFGHANRKPFSAARWAAAQKIRGGGRGLVTSWTEGRSNSINAPLGSQTIDERRNKYSVIHLPYLFGCRY